MASDLVFLTGSTGFVGFAVLRHLLEAGYRVRASVRQGAQVDTLKANAAIIPYAEKLEVIIIPDIMATGAYDQALDGVKFIQHVASPLPFPTENPEQDIVQPAIRGTTNILEAALKTSTVERIVLTGSFASVIPNAILDVGDLDTVYTVNSRVKPAPTAPWRNYGEAYRGSKAQVLEAAERFIAERQPHFTIVTTLPGYVFGANLLIHERSKAISGSNAIILGISKGMTLPGPSRPFYATHLEDLARVQVKSLDTAKVRGNRTFFVGTAKGAYNDVNEIVRKNFPEEVDAAIFPLNGAVANSTLLFDDDETTRIFGPTQGFEQQVIDVVKYFLSL